MSTINENSTNSSENFSIFKIAATLFSIILVRNFLENFAYPDSGGLFFSIERLIHAQLMFFSMFLSFSLLTHFFSKSSFEIIFPFMLKTFLFILMVPIIDFFWTGPSVDALKYLTVEPSNIFSTFFRTMNPSSGNGITFGQHLGAYCIFTAMAIFTFKKTQSILKSILSAFSGYVIIFFYAILPSVVTYLNTNSALEGNGEIETYRNILKQSWEFNAIPRTDLFNNIIHQISTVHELSMARFFWISLVLQVILVLFIMKCPTWNALKKNLRIERIILWFLIATIGITININLFGNIDIQNPINLIAIFSFFLLIVLNIWLAVIFNDCEDINIDRISNPNRPLPANIISKKELLTVQLFLILLIIIGTAITYKSVAFLIVLTQAVYFLYSAKPLRLKKHFVTSSIITGLATVFIAMSGFFLVSPDQHFSAFPYKAILLIGICAGLIFNFKDIKDYEGDFQENMKTIPVVFGLKNSKIIIATFWALAIIVIPLILKLYASLFFSICLALFVFYLFTKKEYQEKYISLVFFLCTVTLLILSL